ncbi:MAG TPA: hypothetical protein VHD87_00480 [Acidimicrobiales bacterium]|nr:hypothetical protein [Acidimicrobiales bacterium]
MARSLRVGSRELPMAVAVPIAVGVLLRLVAAYTDNVVGPDEAAYLGTGRNIWRGLGITYQNGPELHFPPLLPIILGGLAKLTPEPHHATVIVTFVSSCALLGILGALAWRIGGRRAGILALWIAALSPGIGVNLARGTGGSEAIYAAVLCGAALVCVGRRGTWDEPPSVLRSLAVGLLIGAAYLLRPEGILVSAFFGLILGLRALGGRLNREAFTAANLRRFAAVAAACLVGVGVLAGPYVAFLHAKSGHWELTAKSVDVNIQAWRALAAQDRVTRDTYLYKLDASGHSTDHKTYSLTVLARQNPRQYLDIVGENFRQLYKSLLSFNTTSMPGWRLFALPLFPFALWALWKHRTQATVVAVLGVLLVTLAIVIGFFVLNRYLPPVVAALAVLAAVGLAELPERQRRIWVTVGIVASIMSICTYFEGAHGPQIVRERADLQIAARWLRQQHIPPSARVMTRSTALPYYLPHNKLIVPPVGTLEQVWRYARYQNVTYFIYDPTTQLWRPDLLALMDGRDHARDGFATIHTFASEGRTTWIFKVLPREQTRYAARATP